jgi:hypothetical protein
MIGCPNIGRINWRIVDQNFPFPAKSARFSQAARAHA